MYHHLSARQLLPALAGTLFPNQAQGQVDRTSVAASEPAISLAAPTAAVTLAPTEASAPSKPPVTIQTPTNTAIDSVASPTAGSTPLPSSLPPTNTSLSSAPVPLTSAPPSPTYASSAKPQTSSIIYVTITSTGRDGNLYTSVSSSASAIPIGTGLSGSSGSGGGGSPSGSTWAIIGGVVGGLAALAAVIFIVFRCTQRRFSELDDEDVAIKWPELVNRADDSSTLNPLAARQAAGHGVGDDGEEEKPGMSPGQVNQGPYSDTLHRGDTVQSTLYSNGSYGAGPGAYGDHPGYYPDDPYLGPSSAPQPFPPTIPYDQQQHQAYTPLGPSVPYSGARSASPGAPDADGYDQISWGGAEAIPLTVVNSGMSSNTGRQSPSPQHRAE